MQTTFEGRESFIRFGPIRRIQSDDHQRVRFYPWKTNLKGLIVKTSTRPHVKPMVDAINKLLKSSSKEEGFKVATGVQDFFIILWVMHLAQATPFESLYDFVARIQPIERSDLRNKLYCMKLAGWINVYPYGGEAYWYTTSPDDPFTKYSFNTGVATNDPLRRKFEVSRSLREHLNTPRQVGRFVESTKPVSL